MTRPIRSLVTLLAVVVALVGAAACGIDEDKVAGGVQTNGGTDTTTTSTTGTTEPAGPDISLPDIPSDVTQPEDTVPDPTEPQDTVSSGETTPGGLTQADLEAAFVQAGFTEEQAACIATGMFATIDPAAIDSLASGDESQVDPEVLSQFQEIVLTCAQGG